MATVKYQVHNKSAAHFEVHWQLEPEILRFQPCICGVSMRFWLGVSLLVSSIAKGRTIAPGSSLH